MLTGTPQTLWALSADSSLRAMGQQTAINWLLVHDNILEWVVNGLRDRRECVVTLFREWDDELFPDTEDSLGTARGVESASVEGRRRALEALEGMSVMEEGEGDENGDGEGQEADSSN